MGNNDNSKPIIFSSELEDIFQKEDKTKLLQTLHENRESFSSEVFAKVLSNTLDIRLYMALFIFFGILPHIPHQDMIIRFAPSSSIFDGGRNTYPVIETELKDFILVLTGVSLTLLGLNFPHVWKSVKEKYSFLR